MRRAEVEALLQRVGYRPNWVIGYSPEGFHTLAGPPGSARRVDTQEDEGPHHVEFLMYTPDAYDDEAERPAAAVAGSGVRGRLYRQDLELITARTRRMVPEVASDAEFFGWVRVNIADLEEHERNEWFTVDGERVMDAHQVVFVPSSSRRCIAAEARLVCICPDDGKLCLADCEQCPGPG